MNKGCSGSYHNFLPAIRNKKVIDNNLWIKCIMHESKKVDPKSRVS